MPPRFDLKFVNSNDEEETPLCIHRAPLGTHERFIGFLIEHYAGNFPVWLSPEQVRVIPISVDHHARAREISNSMRLKGIRANADLADGRMNRKIREAQLKKVPYMAVVGEREVADGTVSLRTRTGSQETLSAQAFIDQLQNQIKTRAKDLHLH